MKPSNIHMKLYSLLSRVIGETAVPGSLLTSPVTGKPPDSLVHGFMGFEYQCLACIMHSSCMMGSCFGRAVGDTQKTLPR